MIFVSSRVAYIVRKWKKVPVTSILSFSHYVFNSPFFSALWKIKVYNKYLYRNRLTHSHTMTPFDAPGKQAFWKHCGKKRNCS